MGRHRKRKSAAEMMTSRLDMETLLTFPHHLFPSINLHVHDVLDVDRTQPESLEGCIRKARQFFKPFPYDMDLPFPFTKPMPITVEGLNGNDPVLSLVMRKIEWEKMKEKIVSSNLRDKKHIDEYTFRAVRKSKHDKTMLIPRGIAVLASHLAEDPDPCFTGKYNWYYSGGNLTTLSSGGKTYLLSGMSGNTLRKILLDDEWKSQKMSTTTTMKSNSPIHQVLADEDYVAVRQKKEVTILVPKESENDSWIHLKRLHTSVTDENGQANFVSTSVFPTRDLQYCTLTTDSVIRLWQPKATKKYISEVKYTDEAPKHNNWGTIQYNDENTILFLNCNRINLLDIRSMKIVQTWCHSDLCELCEDISMCVASNHLQHLKYIGTSHQVLGLDMRYGFSQRWTHMMALPPYIGCTSPVNRNQRSEEVIATENDCSGDHAESHVLPTLLTSPLQALRSVRLKAAACLGPHVVTRCKMSLTGICCLQRDDSILLMRQNVMGDIFCQKLESNNPIQTESDQVIELWKGWADDCETAIIDQETANTKTLCGMEKHFKAIHSKKKNEACVRKWLKNHKNNTVENCLLPKDYIRACVDELAPKIRNVWEMSKEDWLDSEEEEEEKEEDIGSEHQFHSRLDSASLSFDTNTPGCSWQEGGMKANVKPQQLEKRRLSMPPVRRVAETPVSKEQESKPTRKRIKKTYVPGF